MLLVVFAGLVPVSARAGEYAVAAPPAWVQVAPSLDVGAATPEADLNDGIRYLLTDQQIRIDANGRSSYRRVASMAINATGVESVANIEIRFDPSYSRLTLHSIDIVRDGRVIPKLATAQVRVLQRETSLDYRVFDGTKSVSVFLDDVRVGDVVDYSYSIQGSNPVFGGREFGVAWLQYSDPVARLRVRLLFPAGRALSIEPRNVGVAPTVTERAGERIREWDLRDVAARTVEDGTPGWYDTRPLVQWSEYPDWNSVARWAWPLYEVPARAGVEARAEAERIVRQEPADPAHRMLAVLRFVQGEIRYLAVSIGPGSHAPNAPGRVLERRFGDCKDKARLMVAMLAALGIEARVALVDTEHGRGIRDLQPSPGVFDHAIVWAHVDGRDYWLDPTRSPQNGDAAHVRQADYGIALVVDPQTRSLVPTADVAESPSKRSVTSVFDAGKGLGVPVDYTITTLVEGARADAFRATRATTNLDNLQQQYLNYYARYYPKITVAAPLEIAEDVSLNRVTTVEHYRIEDFWKDVDGGHHATIEVPEVDEVLRQPATIVRKAPLLVSHPIDFSQRTEVRLPDDWSIKPETTQVADPAFLFERSIQGTGRTLTIVDRFQSRIDEVAAADTVRYAGNLARALEATGYQLTWADPGSAHAGGALQRFNWMMAVLALLLAMLWIALAIMVYRRDPPLRDTRVPDPALRGIGGWLILPAIALVVSPFRILYDLRDVLGIFDAGTWSSLTTYGSAAYSSLWAPLLLFELVANLGLLVFSLLAAVMFFQHRRGLPRLYVALMLGGIAVRVADLLLAGLMPIQVVDSADWVGVVRDSIGASIWVAYFLQSKRVEATFVVARRRDVPSVPATHEEAAIEHGA